LPARFCNLSFALLAVFETANLILGETFYEPHVLSVNGGLVINSFGMATQTERADDVPPDTLLIGARPDVREPSADKGQGEVETVARVNGFGDRERLRRSFLRTYGQTPQSIRNASRPVSLLPNWRPLRPNACQCPP